MDSPETITRPDRTTRMSRQLSVRLVEIVTFDSVPSIRERPYEPSANLSTPSPHSADDASSIGGTPATLSRHCLS